MSATVTWLLSGSSRVFCFSHSKTRRRSQARLSQRKNRLAPPTIITTATAASYLKPYPLEHRWEDYRELKRTRVEHPDRTGRPLPRAARREAGVPYHKQGAVPGPIRPPRAESESRTASVLLEAAFAKRLTASGK